jgi:hypothetical protein
LNVSGILKGSEKPLMIKVLIDFFFIVVENKYLSILKSWFDIAKD